MKKAKYKLNVGKLIGNIIGLVSAIVIIYFIACYCEIVAKNVKPNPVYSDKNIITTTLTQYYGN